MIVFCFVKMIHLFDAILLSDAVKSADRFDKLTKNWYTSSGFVSSFVCVSVLCTAYWTMPPHIREGRRMLDNPLSKDERQRLREMLEREIGYISESGSTVQRENSIAT